MAKNVVIGPDHKTLTGMHVIIRREKWYISEGEKKPTIECPLCGEGILGDSAPHGVRKDGTVWASVVCQNMQCKFHSNIKLEDWDGGEIPHS